MRIALAFFALVALAGPVEAAEPTLEQMAGQMVVVGFQGDSAEDKSVKALRDEIAAGEIGGVMYLKTNVASLDAVTEMNQAFLQASPGLPPFITIDQEGGAVERLTAAVGFEEIPNAQEMARQDNAVATGTYQAMADGLTSYLFNVNFGPVVDLNVNPNNPIIAKYGRSFSADPDVVVQYAEAFVQTHRSADVLTALKHFPGHGSSTGDSHEGFVDITSTWSEAELLPYREMVGDGMVDMVMVGHLYHADYSSADRQLPSSLSPEWINGVLRGDLGYDGVVITDDLEMGAIRKLFGLEETVRLAVTAGVDVLLFSNTAKYDPALGGKVRDILMKLAEADPAFRERVVESYTRIARLKSTIQ